MAKLVNIAVRKTHKWVKIEPIDALACFTPWVLLDHRVKWPEGVLYEVYYEIQVLLSPLIYGKCGGELYY